MTVIDIISAICMGLGCLLGLIGGLGMHRLNDFYTRLHAVGITDTLCSFLILLALALQTSSPLVAFKLLLIFMFLFFTSPTASFTLANNAWQWGLQPRDLDGKKLEIKSGGQDDS